MIYYYYYYFWKREETFLLFALISLDSLPLCLSSQATQRIILKVPGMSSFIIIHQAISSHTFWVGKIPRGMVLCVCVSFFFFSHSQIDPSKFILLLHSPYSFCIHFPFVTSVFIMSREKKLSLLYRLIGAEPNFPIKMKVFDVTENHLLDINLSVLLDKIFATR